MALALVCAGTSPFITSKFGGSAGSYNGLMRASVNRWGGMFAGLLFLGVPGPAHAACRPGADDPVFSQAVAEGNYTRALEVVLRELPLSQIERSQIRIVQGLSRQNGDSHGQTDPD